MKTTVIALLFTTLAGCGSMHGPARIAVLQNPETKQTVECRVDPWGDMNRRRQIDNCIAAYEKAGYRLVADSGTL